MLLITQLVLSLSAGPVPIGPFPQDEDLGDLVVLRDGETESGTVLEETLAGLALDPLEGARKTLAWSSVASIQYGDAPDEFMKAQATLEAGNLELSLESLQLVLAAEDVRPVVRQQALFHCAHVLQRLGRAEEARSTYAQLLQEFPKGRFVKTAGDCLIALHVQAGDEPGARAALDRIKPGLADVAVGPAVLGLLEAGLLAASGKQDEAQKRYAAVEGLNASAELGQEARLGRARMLLAGGKGTEAEPLLRQLVTESESSHVQSGAWNSLGDVLAGEGRSRREASRILDALYAYLRTVVQYKPLPGESTLEYERALAGAGTCFQYLSELEQNAEKKRVLRDQQRQRLDQLQREFPNSTFLEKN